MNDSLIEGILGRLVVVADLSFKLSKESKLSWFGIPLPKFRRNFNIDSSNEVGCINDVISEFSIHSHTTHVESAAHISSNISSNYTLNIIRELPILIKTQVIDVDHLESDKQMFFPNVECVLLRTGYLHSLVTQQQKTNDTLTEEETSPPPCLSPEIIKFITDRIPQIKILGIDAPSIDPVSDGGLLKAHRSYFNGIDGSKRLVMELVCISPEIKTNYLYYMSLNSSAFELDAIPCRPTLYDFLNENIS